MAARAVRTLRSLARNGALTRVALAWLFFLIAEYAVWIGMLVYAYARAGATGAGIVAVAQLIPGIAVGPLLATMADRRSPVVVLIGGYAAQTAGMAATAAVLYSHGPAMLAYAGAIVAATAVTATRPAQAALIPALAHSADELTVSNAVLNWLDTVAIVLAGLVAGVALSTGRTGLVFVIGAVCTTLSAALLTGIAVRPMGGERDDDEEPSALTLVREGLAVIHARPQSRVLVGIITAEYIVIGALDVLFVVIAVSQLHAGQGWAGYLNTAFGVGGLGAVAVTMTLLGRSLGRPLIGAATLLCVALALVAFTHSEVLTLVLFGFVGLGRAVLDMATHTLLQRTVPAEVLGRIFGLVEGMTSGGLAIGALLVPLLVQLGGAKAAVIGTAAVVPLVALAGGRAISSLDAAAHVPVVEIALLRSMPHFRALPAPELEGLAQAAERRAYRRGETIIRQGDSGDLFYAIAEGEVDIFVDGAHVGSCGRSEGIGEIALLRRAPRSATVVAKSDAVLYALDGDAFVTVVTGHEATRRFSEDVVAGHLDRGQASPPD